MSSHKNKQVYAGFWVRGAAFLIDCIFLTIIQWVVAFGLFMLWSPSMAGRDPQMTMEITQYVLSTFMGLAYFWILQTYLAATPGKMIFGLRLVNQSLGRPSYKQTFIRWLMTFPSSLLLFGGYIAVGFHTKKQGWHDRVAGTLVVRTDAIPQKARQKLAA